jgi:ubiquinone/menaquinone biosynthesis C-methylase UbiE
MDRSPSDHARVIADQFTKQADPFAALPIHTQEESLTWLREELRDGAHGHVLDAGCGPGLVACALAPFAASVTALDATPAMLAKARQLAADRGIPNVVLREGTMEALPFADAAFDGVVTRYTFHHLLDPALALDELVRVCRRGGRVVVCDASPRSDRRAAYDRWERVRDPSHTSARTADELTALAGARLADVTVRRFRLPSPVEALIASSFPVDGGAERLRREMEVDVGVDALDMNARWESGRLMMSFPITVVGGTVP